MTLDDSTWPQAEPKQHAPDTSNSDGTWSEFCFCDSTRDSPTKMQPNLFFLDQRGHHLNSQTWRRQQKADVSQFRLFAAPRQTTCEQWSYETNYQNSLLPAPLVNRIADRNRIRPAFSPNRISEHYAQEFHLKHLSNNFTPTPWKISETHQ